MVPRKILEAMLLELLSSVPDGLSTQDAYAAIEKNYRLPALWRSPRPTSNGYTALQRRGFTHASLLPERELRVISTEPMWQNLARWARNSLRRKGFLDPMAGKGRWRLTPKGMDAATRPTQFLDREEDGLFQHCLAASEGFVAQHTFEDRDRLHGLSLELQELLNLARRMSKVELDELLARARAVLKSRRGG